MSQFPTTAWSLIVSASNAQSEQSREALERLCSAYWYPVYAYIRRKQFNAENARDLTQEFFATLIEKGFVAAADRSRGRFRTFLLTAVQRFLYNAHDRDLAIKRGARVMVKVLETDEAERRYDSEPSHSTTPEILYERRWAFTVLERAWERLKSQTSDARVEQMASFLAGEADRGDYNKVASELGMTEGSLKVAVHRLRKIYREVLRSEIVETVGEETHVEDEIRYLMSVLRNA